MVFLFLLIFLILIITSKIRVEVNNIKFSTKKIDNSHLNEKYNIKIKFVILKVIPVFWININKTKIDKLKNKNRFKNNISKDNVKNIGKYLNINIKKIYLYLKIGTESTVFTAMVVPIISTVIAIILARKKVKIENQNYKVIPNYNSRKFCKSTLLRYI